MQYKYRIEGIPPSSNRYSGRKNCWEYRKDKKEWMRAVWYACRTAARPQRPVERSVVRIKYYFKDKRRRDPDNYSGKFLQDGLVAAGIIADDSFSHIRLELSAEFGCGADATEIEVEDVSTASTAGGPPSPGGEGL